MRRIQQLRRQERRAGSALVAGLVTGFMLMGISLALMAVTLRSNQHQMSSIAIRQALDSATSGVNHAMAGLEGGQDGDVGSEKNPIQADGSSYWADVEPGTVDGTFVVTSTGVARGHSQSLEVVVALVDGGVFQNAIFAGNSSGDPTYTLELGGTGGQADEIYGDVYSGQHIVRTGDATVSGTASATGSITGMSGLTGVKQPTPDIAGMDYANTADYDVAAMFDAGSSYKPDAAGGWAYQLPKNNPAHIFRKNPSDRTSATGSTVKDDFFLEDPYEKVKADYAQDGSYPYQISLSGVGNNPGENGNRKVYYVDGNIWIHNKKTYSLGFEGGDPDGIQVTFVASGNVYISDNVFYDDDSKDGVAFIAIKDPDVADSGNVYLGDPDFGTLRRMSSFLFAEEDFYDVNLDASGSAVVELNGNMTAGDQVVIDRDHPNGSHTKLIVDFDDRIANGALQLPGLPGWSGAAGDPEYMVLSWRRVGAQ